MNALHLLLLSPGEEAAVDFDYFGKGMNAFHHILRLLLRSHDFPRW